jgi:lysophospholipase
MPQLIAMPDNPIPDGAHTAEIRTTEGRRLRTAIFRCPGRPRGAVALLQGHGEFIEKYFETVEALQARGFDVATFDWRGQGGSERELDDPAKGHIDDFAHYQNDLLAFVTQIMTELPQPWFALAHSMGGAILLDAAYRARPPFERLVLTAPMIDLANLRFPKSARWLAETLDMVGLGGMFVPFGKRKSFLLRPFPENPLTTDPIRFARNAAIIQAAPELALIDPTVGWINAAFRLIGQFGSPDYARRIRTPVLTFACGLEKIVSNNAIERFTGNLNAGAFIMIHGAKHELLMERDPLREQFWRAFDAFIPGETLS